MLSGVAGQVLARGAAGRTEREVALAIDWRLREAGFERPAFETIVASGPNAALPHARPTERKLSEGDLVVLDFGGVYDSYCVDLTRTVSVGPASRARPRGLRRGAERPTTGRSRPSARGSRGSPSTRPPATSLDEAGMGEAFGHGTGHGLGIEVHEDPRIARRRPDVDAGDEAGRRRHGVHHRAGRVLPGLGRRPNRRRCAWSRTRASSC